MDVGMTLPTMLPHGRDEVLAWCRGIDEGPWTALSVPERITFTSHSLTVQLAAAAALTERVPLWTTVIVLPAYDEVQVAKDMASVDQLCDGRLTLAVGSGGREHDARAVGADYAGRSERMDRQVERMRRIWAGEPPFEGADPVGPPPVQPGGPPIVAGVMGPKAIARAAAWAAGIDQGNTVLGLRRDGGDPFSDGLSFDEESLAADVARMKQAWRDAGRSEEPDITASLWYALGEGAQERLQQYVFNYLRLAGDDIARHIAGRATCNTAAALRDSIDVMASAGVHRVFLNPTTVDPRELERTREALGM